MEETGRKLFAIDLDYVSQTQKFDGNNKIGRTKFKLARAFDFVELPFP